MSSPRRRSMVTASFSICFCSIYLDILLFIYFSYCINKLSIIFMLHVVSLISWADYRAEVLIRYYALRRLHWEGGHADLQPQLRISFHLWVESLGFDHKLLIMIVSDSLSVGCGIYSFFKIYHRIRQRVSHGWVEYVLWISSIIVL